MSWHYWNNYRKDNTKEKYSSLIYQLQEKRNTFCGIGTRKIKMRLNKLAKDNTIALIYRKALEIEDKNIQAKAYPDYRDRNYEEKSELLNELVKLCIDNNINVGFQEAETENDFISLYIVYVDLPGCEQISWHTQYRPQCNIYNGEWDKKEESTLPKLEEAITKLFPEILK